jgi:hypothetical protein
MNSPQINDACFITHVRSYSFEQSEIAGFIEVKPSTTKYFKKWPNEQRIRNMNLEAAQVH